MTPKEKAKELIDKYNKKILSRLVVANTESTRKWCSKDCALIAVDEMLGLCWNGNEIALNYWQQVKNEIELL